MSRRYVSFFLAFILALVTNGFSPATQAAENKKVILQLGWDHQFQFAGYYAASWQGFYADAGLDVEFRSRIGPGGKFRNRSKEVAEGRADFGIGGVDILVARGKGVPLKILASIFQHSGLAFYAKADKGLETLSDMVRLRVGQFRPGGRASVELNAMLQAEGIDPEKINYVLEGKGIADLMGKTVDVVAGYTISADWLARESGLTLTSISPTAYGVDFYGDALFTRQSVIDDDAELVERFVDASLKGWEYALAHAEETADRISRDLPRSLPVNDLIGYNRSLIEPIRKLIDPTLIELGHVNPDRWWRMYETLVRMGLFNERFEPDDLFFNPQTLRNEQHQNFMRVLYLLLGGGALALGLAWTLTMRRTVIKRTSELQFEITERKEAEDTLRESEEKYRNLVETSRDLIWAVDSEGKFQYVNESASLSILGYEANEMIGKSLTFFKTPEQAEEDMKEFLKTKETGHLFNYETTYQAKDGTLVPINLNAVVIKDEDGNIVGTTGTAQDISERKKAEEGMRQAAAVFDSANEGIMVTDADGVIKIVNSSFSKITGFLPEDAVGKLPSILKSGHHDAAFYGAMRKSLADTGAWEGEIWNRRKSGEVFPEWQSITAIKNKDGNVVDYVSLFSDITKRKQAEEELHYRANYDPLTRLPNRDLFFERQSQEILHAKRNGKSTAMLFIDLDHFKAVNDTLGHPMGDELLRQTAKRLETCIREVDTVARVGGDEFVVGLSDISGAQDALRVAEQVIETLSERYLLDGTEAFVGASIGITIFPDDGDAVSTLFKNADLAMYRAKKSGRNNYQFYTPSLTEEVIAIRALEIDLRNGIENEQFVVYYQPIIDIQMGDIVSAEALTRWQHPERGLVMPDEFIGIAEEKGLIRELGLWVLTSACRQLAAWKEAGIIQRIAVNVSVRQLPNNLPTKLIAAILEENGLLPDSLSLEITETVMMEEEEGTRSWLREVEGMGVGLSVDDFGTQHSSVSYLRRFSVDTVKIDRSFIANIPLDANDAALAEAIIAMAHALNLKVCAEGVETKEQLEFLQSRSCDLAQGFYFSKPIPPDQFETMARSRANSFISEANGERKTS